MTTQDERILPQPQLTPEEIEQQESEVDEELQDLFSVSEEDVIGDDPEDLSDLTGGPGEDTELEDDDLSDLVDVSREDVMGAAPAKPKRLKITPRGRSSVRQPPPPATMGGIE